jgi:pilus assembly protein FimV
MKSDADPTAEADVYLAYGRPAQAAEILKEAIKTQPCRAAEFQAKLIEIQKIGTEVQISKKIPKAFLFLASMGELFFLATSYPTGQLD